MRTGCSPRLKQRRDSDRQSRAEAHRVAITAVDTLDCWLPIGPLGLEPGERFSPFPSTDGHPLTIKTPINRAVPW